MYLHAKLRTVLFFLFCMRATPLLLKLQSLQTSLQSCLQAICLHRVISFVLLCYSRCGRSCILHFCIHFLSPQAAKALQVAAREVSVAITCVEPRSPHAQAARGRISSMDLCASRTNRFTYTPTTTGCVYHCASWPEEEEAVQMPTSEYSKVLCNCVIQLRAVLVSRSGQVRS